MNDDERIERALKSIGDEYVRANPPNYPAFREGVLRRQRGRRWFQAGSALALAGATVAIGLFFTRSTPVEQPRVPAAGQNVTKAITDRVRVGETPSQINVGRNYVWVTSKSGTVTRIDPSTKVPFEIDVGGLPTDLAVGGSGVWVANNGRLQRLESDGSGDPEVYDITDSAARMHVSVSPGAVWVVVSGEEVFEIDPDNGRKTPFPAGRSPVDIAVADGILWALDASGEIQGYDVDSGDPVGDAIPVPVGINAEITLGSKALWYGVQGDTTFMRVDLDTNDTRTVTLPSDYVDMGVGKGEVWVLMRGADDTGVFAAADPETGRLAADKHAIDGSPVDIAVGRQALWIVNAAEGRALRVQKDLLDS